LKPRPRWARPETAAPTQHRRTGSRFAERLDALPDTVLAVLQFEFAARAELS
jgi:hypothetical protein